MRTGPASCFNSGMRLDDVRDLISKHAGEATPIVDGAVISKIEHSGPPELSTTGTVLVLLAQGAKRLAVGDQVHDYAAGQCLVASVDLPVSGHFVDTTPESPALGFALTLRPALIAELLLQANTMPRPPVERDRGSTGISVGDASPDLIDAVGRMVRLVERPADRSVLAPLIERELHWLVLSSPHGVSARDLGLADSGVSRVGHAVRWIREHHTEPFRVVELADLARMSQSAFHRAFRAVTALSPIEYQKQVRLQEARIRLVATPGDVAGAARAVGYTSPSQFSRDYRRRFGAAPSQDAARLNEAGGAR